MLDLHLLSACKALHAYTLTKRLELVEPGNWFNSF